MQTLGAGSSTQLECTLMTHDQYVDLKNEYRAMMKELRRYNEHRASQQEPTAPKQYRLRPNPEPKQSDSVTPQIRDVTGQRQTYTYASEAFTY